MDKNVSVKGYIDRLVRSSTNFVALHQPTLFIYSFRYAPEALRALSKESTMRAQQIDGYLDRLNQMIADQIQLSGIAFVMTTRIRNRTVLRLSISSHRTIIEDIDLVFAKLEETDLELQSRYQSPD